MKHLLEYEEWEELNKVKEKRGKFVGTINDDILGEFGIYTTVVPNYWKSYRKEKINFYNNKEYKIFILLPPNYKLNDEIKFTKETQKSYKVFKSSLRKIENQLDEKLIGYANNEYQNYGSNTIATTKNIRKLTKLDSIWFALDNNKNHKPGQYVIIGECDWDPEHGVSILMPNLQVGQYCDVHC